MMGIRWGKGEPQLRGETNVAHTCSHSGERRLSCLTMPHPCGGKESPPISKNCPDANMMPTIQLGSCSSAEMHRRVAWGKK